MATSREDFGRRTHYSDEFGNPVNKPSTIATYGHPSSTDNSQAYGTPETATDGKQHERRPAEVADDYDPTQRRGTTTGEYGTSGIGLMDSAKEKLDGVGGFIEDPGHTPPLLPPLQAEVVVVDENGAGQKGFVEKIKEKVV